MGTKMGRNLGLSTVDDVARSPNARTTMMPSFAPWWFYREILPARATNATPLAGTPLGVAWEMSMVALGVPTGYAAF
jgi:hypothetical protein